MNIDLLQRVKAAILAEPESFDIDTYFGKQEACGTTACIAGHALVCSEVFENRDDGYEKTATTSFGFEFYTARTRLGLDADLAMRLFLAVHWPSEFANRYRRNKTARGRAKVAAERIDYFIETGK